MKVLKHQIWHLLLLIILLVGVYYYIQTDASLIDGSYLGIKTKTWFLISIIIPILHQIYVVICWRLELYYKSISKAFGTSGFLLYKIGFTILFVSRLLSIICLGIASLGTLQLNPVVANSLAVFLFIPSLYLFYSVKTYFGFDRAFGIDHFYPDKLKNEPFVRKGIFKYTTNGMYIFGFFILWVPGLLYLSKAALVAALFNHIYIWVHYFFTELPDIKVIYGK